MRTAATANREEIDRFNALAETWWDPTGPMWPLHKLNAVRAPFILDVLSQQGLVTNSTEYPLQDLRVLDIGCGAGLLSESMAAAGARVIGVDPAARNIAIALVNRTPLRL